MSFKYDDSNQESIVVYARKLLHKRLRDFVDEVTIADIGDNSRSKGGYGNIVEEYYFGYKPNSNPEPDFKKVGVELKTSPIKKLKSGKKVAKERLVMNMIDFTKIVNESRNGSSFLKKNKKLLLMFYLYEKGISFWDYIMELISLREFPEKDLLLMEQDRNKIQSKVKEGKAHELSEGDTFYLGACTKSQTSLDRTGQPHSSIMAKPRAFSLKQTYVNKIIEHLYYQEEKEDSILQDLSILKRETFEGYIKSKFDRFIGKTPKQIADELGIPLNEKTKQYLAILARKILGVEGNKIEEFEKANVTLKAVRLMPKGKLKESISFPAFDPKEIINQEWEDSDLLQMMDKKFFFVVFQYDEKGSLSLKKVMFRNMPYSNLDIDVRWVFDETKRRILSGDIKNLPKIKENPVSHVRPHGKNKKDVSEYPNGEKDVKKCFRLNAKYLANQIK